MGAHVHSYPGNSSTFRGPKGDDDWVKKCMKFNAEGQLETDGIFLDWIFYLVSVWIDMAVIIEIPDVLHFVPTAWSFIGSV